MAKSWNMRIFKHLRREADAARVMLAEERGPCPDAAERGVMERFSPQAGDRADRVDLDHLRRHQRRHRADPGQHLHPQDPVGLVRGQEPLPGAAARRERARTRDEIWRSILENEGSVQHLDCLTEDEKAVYKTAFEIDQRWVVELAADRAPTSASRSRSTSSSPATSISGTCTCCTGTAWERGVKSLYYLRSKSVQRAAFAGGDGIAAMVEKAAGERTDYDECLACQ